MRSRRAKLVRPDLDVQADVEDGGGVGEGAARDEVGADVGEAADGLQGDAAGQLDERAADARPRRRARRPARRSGGPRRAPCCRAARRRRRPRGPRAACRRCRTRRGRACRGRRRGPRPPRRRCRARVRWLSLSITHSERLPRWLAAPPARTAAFSSARRPGVVLRVSHTRIAGPAASTKRRVRVATPERWHTKLRAVRSAVSTDASGPATVPSTWPAVTASPSAAVPAALHRRVDLGERLGGAVGAGQHAVGAGHEPGLRPWHRPGAAPR